MRKIRDISEDEMIAIYLQTELSSVRFRQKLELHIEQEKIDTYIIQEPDWHNAAENVLATRGAVPSTDIGGEGCWRASRRHGRTRTIDRLSHCA